MLDGGQNLCKAQVFPGFGCTLQKILEINLAILEIIWNYIK